MSARVIFVHGLGGNESTWSDFPRLIKEDPKLDLSIDFMNYPTPFLGIKFLYFLQHEYQAIEDLAKSLKTLIDEKHCDVDEIVLVGHSMGGRYCCSIPWQWREHDIPVRLVVILDSNPQIPVADNVQRCVNLYVTNQLGMAILTLLRHPDAHAWLVAHPDGIDRATEELLRYESAFGQTTWRFFTEDTEFGDHTVPAGDSVIISLMAANRDPAKFRCPAELDLQRTPNPHLAFGHGVHFCPGAHLARIQIQETLTAITARITDLRLDCEETDLEFLHAPLARGVTKLPIRYSAVKPA